MGCTSLPTRVSLPCSIECITTRRYGSSSCEYESTAVQEHGKAKVQILIKANSPRCRLQMTGNYGPAAAAAAAAAAGNTTGRTVYVGNLPAGELWSGEA
jgi:hypothetical protein